MESQAKNFEITEAYQAGSGMPVLTDERRLLLKELFAFPGRDILNRIMNLDDPREMVLGLTCEDFFWVIKKVGEEDSPVLLELASVDQWQYLLDLEIWERDRLDISHASRWMTLLQQADCRKLVRWLFSEGEYLAYYHFFRTLEVVVINDKDEVFDIPDGFFSLDGVFYIRVLDPQYRESMEDIIRVMVDEDLTRYQALLLGLAGVLPAEAEEEMYRLRNVRLAEHGFLPYEEAIEVYSPLDPGVLEKEERQDFNEIIHDSEIRAIIPLLPLSQTGTQNVFMDVVGRTGDSIFLERLRLEFAGLANQILSADGIVAHEIETLVEACKKGARVINLAIEKACGNDLLSAEKLLRCHSLVTLFRVGFGMALKLKWEAEHWLKGSWFYRLGLDPDFWGEHWGGILKGLLEKRPRLYVGPGQKEEYKDFEWLSDLGECLKALRGLMVLDGLLEKLVESHPLKEEIIHSPELTFHPILFNLWARLLLKIEPSFSGISLEKAKTFLYKLRGQSRKPPYKMEKFRRTFITDFMAHASDADPETASMLEKTLSLIWEEFREEYELVSISDFDGRYSKFVTIINDLNS
ncbi:MAG: hypothetical protein JRI94_14690 [Deltaproteobacteria bacterium]|nr:hypothetical protein [Deltaproteobacteria bacterium]MBW2115161.1 hypothetical protein [Deltaproteobacteria bacterium]